MLGNTEMNVDLEEAARKKKLMVDVMKQFFTDL